MIRLAEVLLIKAEALARQNDLAGAVDAYKPIRERAGLPPHVLGVDVTTQDEVLAAIDPERRLELAFEGDRWPDLVRTGQAVGSGHRSSRRCSRSRRPSATWRPGSPRTRVTRPLAPDRHDPAARPGRFFVRSCSLSTTWAPSPCRRGSCDYQGLSPPKSDHVRGLSQGRDTIACVPPHAR